MWVSEWVCICSKHIYIFMVQTKGTKEKNGTEPSVYIEIEMKMKMNGFYFGTVRYG